MTQFAFHLTVGFNKEKKPLLERTAYVPDLADIELESIVKAMHVLFGKSATITLRIDGI